MYISNALVRHIFSPTFIFFPDLSGGVVFLAGLVCLLSLPSACVKEGKWVCPRDVWRVAFVYCFMIKICFHCQYISRKRRSWGINRQWRCIWRMYRRNNPHIELIAEFSYNPLYSLFSFVFEIKLNRFRFSSILFSCGLWRETENIEIQVFSVTADCRPIAISFQLNQAIKKWFQVVHDVSSVFCWLALWESAQGVDVFPITTTCVIVDHWRDLKLLSGINPRHLVITWRMCLSYINGVEMKSSVVDRVVNRSTNTSSRVK